MTKENKLNAMGAISMKALFLSDEVNQLHWSVLKALCFVLSLLPLSQSAITLWSLSDASSQIMVAFLSISVLSSVWLVTFFNALQLTVVSLTHLNLSPLETQLIRIYRQVPMMTLAGMMAYMSFIRLSL